MFEFAVVGLDEVFESGNFGNVLGGEVLSILTGFNEGLVDEFNDFSDFSAGSKVQFQRADDSTSIIVGFSELLEFFDEHEVVGLSQVD